MRSVVIRSINHDGAIAAAAAAREVGWDWESLNATVCFVSVVTSSGREGSIQTDSPTDTPNGLVLTIGIAACRDDVALSGHEEVVNGSCMLHDSCKCALVGMTGIFMHVTFH